MVWWNLLFFAASFVLTALLAPKPKIENARASSLDDLRFPRASDGSPVPFAIGKNRLRAPNTLWYGNFRAEPIIEKGPRKYGLFGPKKKITVGYKYYLSFDLGLCLGPNVVLTKVWIDKDEVWSGSVGPAAAGLSISKNDLFGGDKSGGGFSSSATFYGGNFDQGADTHIADSLGSLYPAYVGQAHIVFQGAYIGTSASLRAMSFEVERYTNNLGLTNEQVKIGDDLNVAEVLYTVLVTKWGLLGLSTAIINIPSIQLAAITLAAEANGMSLVVSSSNTGKDVISECLRQMDGILYQDPETGSITLKLIRQDYDILTIPEFGPEDIVSVQQFTRTSWQDTYNQVRIQYTARDQKYETRSAMEHDMANINMQGGRVRSTNISFPGCTVAALASELATRELVQLSVPLYSATLEINRRAGSLRPGDPFIFSWPEYGIEQVVMRVGKFNMGELLNGRIVIECTQDEFASAVSVFAAPGGTGWTPPVRTAFPIADYKVMEAPYFMAANIMEGEVINAGEGAFYNLARAPAANQLGFSTRLYQPTGFTDFVVGMDQESFTSTLRLSAAMQLGDGFLDGVISSLVVDDISDTRHINGTIPTANGLANIRQGGGLFVIGNEILAYESASAAGAIWTLTNVHRALLDTDFEAHPDNSLGFFLDDPAFIVDGVFKTTNADPTTTRFQSFTDKDAYPWDTAPVAPLTPNRRFERPLPPDNLRVGTSRAIQTLATATNHTLNWNRRNRLGTDVRVQVDADQTTEAGVTYSLAFYLNGVLQPAYNQSGLTGTTATINFTAGTVGYGEIRMRATRDGLDSYTTTSIYCILGTPLVADRPAYWSGLLHLIV